MTRYLMEIAMFAISIIISKRFAVKMRMTLSVTFAMGQGQM